MSAFSFQSKSKKLADLLSIDFCPSANRWVYWLKNPFWVLVLAIIGSGLCAALLNPMIFVLTALLLLVTLIATGLPWMAIRRVSCDVIFDVKRVRYGEPALVRLRIRNRNFFPVWGLSCIDGFAHSDHENAASDSDDGLAFGRIGGRTTVEYTWPFVSKRRGVYPVNETVKVETSFPFGLYRAQKNAEVVGRLIVWPETVELAGLPDSIESESADDQFSDRRVGEFGDMLGTRSFRQGDSLRRVHWAQTARQQSLIVTERQAPVTTVARIVLDTSARNHPEEKRGQTLEQCVRVAASVCKSLHDQHCRVELQIGDDLIVGGQNTGGLERIMDALANADVNDSASPRTQLTPREFCSFNLTITTSHGASATHGPQIIVTTDGDCKFDEAGVWMTLPVQASISDLRRLWMERV